MWHFRITVFVKSIKAYSVLDIQKISGPPKLSSLEVVISNKIPEQWYV